MIYHVVSPDYLEQHVVPSWMYVNKSKVVNGWHLHMRNTHSGQYITCAVRARPSAFKVALAASVFQCR